MTPARTQVVVLAGGLGTRLGTAGQTRPKVLQPVHGRVFLDIMLEPLRHQGFRRFCFCLGHLAGQVVEHVEVNLRWLDPSFQIDAGQLGTGGSLLAARGLLDDVFLLVLGDTYLDISYADLVGRLIEDALGVMVVTDAVTEVPGNVEFAGGRVIRYDKRLGGRTRWVDSGVLVLRRQALDLLAGTPYPVDLSMLFQRLIARRGLLVQPTHLPFFDIGTPQRLARFAAYVGARPPKGPVPRSPRPG